LSWSLVFTERYNRRAARFLRRHPDLRQAYRKTLLLLEANPHHPSLRLHPLRVCRKTSPQASFPQA
jgi:hypothetical protein